MFSFINSIAIWAALAIAAVVALFFIIAFLHDVYYWVINNRNK